MNASLKNRSLLTFSTHFFSVLGLAMFVLALLVSLLIYDGGGLGSRHLKTVEIKHLNIDDIKDISYIRNCYLFCTVYKKVKNNKNDSLSSSQLNKSIYNNKLSKLLNFFSDIKEKDVYIVAKASNSKLLYSKSYNLLFVISFVLLSYYISVYFLFVELPSYDIATRGLQVSDISNKEKIIKILKFGYKYSVYLISVSISLCFIFYNLDQRISYYIAKEKGELISYVAINEYKPCFFCRSLQEVVIGNDNLFIPKPYLSILYKNKTNKAYVLRTIFRAKGVRMVRAIPKLNIWHKDIPLVISLIAYFISLNILLKKVPRFIYIKKQQKTIRKKIYNKKEKYKAVLYISIFCLLCLYFR